MRKKRVDNSENPAARTYDCEKSGKHKPKKINDPARQRNKGSKKTNCPFFLNAAKTRKDGYVTIRTTMSCTLILPNLLRSTGTLHMR
jgi:hypothetical protein